MNSLIRFEHPQYTLSGLLDEFFNDSGYEAIDRNILGNNWPKVDIMENNNDYILRADLPGMEKGDFNISVENGVLSIEGEKKGVHKEQKSNYYHLECSYGKFKRSFSLPEEVNAEGIEAKLENGVLELKLPRNQKVKPKMIEIKVQ
ncbi:MAG TPA: Hsp20/alpha crystallin family protein [Chitinispirillaceae bacterium]|nr:Hsp20/alpha crystallin family protein [Chitinispirillaceae bacterium]